MVRDMVLGVEEEDTLYEEDKTVFLLMHLQNRQFFLAVLIVIPCTLDFLARVMYSYALLDRLYHLQVAAKTLAVRRSQKLVMVKELHRKKARYRLEVGIGKSPHLSDDDLWLRAWSWQRRRSENRKAFANIWSDMVFGISLFVILYAKQSKVALLKVYRISDTGKAFLIILATDIFLG
ncbi:chloroplast envelope membrane protein [Brassica napus]|uniref:chloroplast envelope membrane protein n=1 Tax=Brassica napus TaxID=3708 RepID=UPI0020786971|nr:chloroplast envelope membrane protein [Brassica napus]